MTGAAAGTGRGRSAAASGVPLCVFGFLLIAFPVIRPSLANAGLVDASAELFVPVSFGTGALGMFVGGPWDSGRRRRKES